MHSLLLMIWSAAISLAFCFLLLAFSVPVILFFLVVFVAIFSFSIVSIFSLSPHTSFSKRSTFFFRRRLFFILFALSWAYSLAFQHHLDVNFMLNNENVVILKKLLSYWAFIKIPISNHIWKTKKLRESFKRFIIKTNVVNLYELICL